MKRAKDKCRLDAAQARFLACEGNRRVIAALARDELPAAGQSTPDAIDVSSKIDREDA